MEDIEGLSPLRIILAVFLILIIILMTIPFYTIKLDPYPRYIPTIDEVFDRDMVKDIYRIESGYIRDYVSSDNPIIKLTANRIISLSCDSSNNICHAKALYLFVRDNILYISDPDTEYYETASEVLLGQGSDCDGMAILLLSLMESVGIESRFVMIPGHVYVQIYLEHAPKRYKNDGWISLDPTCKTCDFAKIPISDARKTYIE